MIETPRLRLRRWRDEDRAPVATLNADEAVGYWIAGPVSRAESDAQIDRFEAHAEGHGFTSWAVADRQSDQLIGMCGLRHLHGMPFGDAVEAAWRLARPHWGKGYVTEAAAAALEDGWRRGLVRVVAITAVSNVRSQGVMERIGMTYQQGGDFGHPRLKPDHPLSRHVLYAIDRPE